MRAKAPPSQPPGVELSERRRFLARRHVEHDWRWEIVFLQPDPANDKGEGDRSGWSPVLPALTITRHQLEALTRRLATRAQPWRSRIGDEDSGRQRKPKRITHKLPPNDALVFVEHGLPDFRVDVLIETPASDSPDSGPPREDRPQLADALTGEEYERLTFEAERGFRVLAPPRVRELLLEIEDDVVLHGDPQDVLVKRVLLSVASVIERGDPALAADFEALIFKWVLKNLNLSWDAGAVRRGGVKAVAAQGLLDAIDAAQQQSDETLRAKADRYNAARERERQVPDGPRTTWPDHLDETLIVAHSLVLAVQNSFPQLVRIREADVPRRFVEALADDRGRRREALAARSAQHPRESLS